MPKKEQNTDPDWLDPKKTRKIPYTDEEIELLVDGFIESFPDEYNEICKNDGPNTARVILRQRYRERDPNSPYYRGSLLDFLED